MNILRTVGCCGLVSVATVCVVLAQERKADKPADLKEAASSFVEQLSKGNFAGATESFDTAMLKALPENKLRETWSSLIKQAGPFQKQTAVRQESGKKYEIVYVTCLFKELALDARLVFDKDRKITGLFFTPHAAAYQAPDYVRREAFTEHDVTIGSGEWALPGSVCVPLGLGPFPGIVLVHGSGSTDRDEAIFSNRPFRDLAWGLASRGIAVLRYDKRSKVHGRKVKDIIETFTVKEETIDDALLAVALLRKTEKIDAKKIFVIGHSLGGICLPRIGALDPGIAGLISMAGTTRPLEDVIADQFTYILSLGELSDEQRKETEKLRQQAADLKGLKLTRDLPTSKIPLGMTAVYLMSLHEIDPMQLAPQVKQPMLILQGERDYQATMEDFAGWKTALAGHTNASFKSYPKLNHLFMEGVGKARPEEYVQKTGHVAKEVLDDIAAWVGKQ
jgi:dienelactone hydrolase